MAAHPLNGPNPEFSSGECNFQTPAQSRVIVIDIYRCVFLLYLVLWSGSIAQQTFQARLQKPKKTISVTNGNKL